MAYDPDVHHRRSIRYRGYYYSQPGAYYVTICVGRYRCLLGQVVEGRVRHNEAGHTVDRAWKSIPSRFPSAELDEYVVMPNHFHAIIRILGAPARDVGAPLVGARYETGQAQGLPLRLAPVRT
jgi:putative transposase